MLCDVYSHVLDPLADRPNKAYAIAYCHCHLHHCRHILQLHVNYVLQLVVY